MPRVACWLGTEIIRIAMDNDGSANCVPHAKTVCLHSQIAPAVAEHQGRQVARVVGMGAAGGVIVAARVGKTISKTAVALVNVQRKETCAAVLRQTAYSCHKQNTSALLIKSDCAGYVRIFRSAFYVRDCIRRYRRMEHIITSHSVYATVCIAVRRGI